MHDATGWRVPLLWLASVVVRLWACTLRVRYDAEGFRKLHAEAGPLTMMLWHNRLFMVPWLVRSVWPGRGIHALVSASRDGGNLVKFFEYTGLHAVRGSSSRFGREALHELIAVQRRGGDIAITPDGPRGPIYQLKAGALLAARRTGSPLLLLGIEYGAAWRIRSWDRFCIPKPFSAVVVRFEVIDPAALPAGSRGIDLVRHRLLELSGEAVGTWTASSAQGTDTGEVS